MILKRLSISGALLAFGCATAFGTIFQADSVVGVSSFFNSNYDPENTIDGSGLLGPLNTLPDHADYATGNHWTTAAQTNPLDAWIQWGFDSPVTLGAIYLWNHRSNLISNNPGYDVGDFQLTFFDSVNAVLGTFNGTLAFDSAAAQSFSFGSLISGVSSVRLDVNSVQSSPNYTGLAEVAFDDEILDTRSVPDAGSSAFMALISLAALGMANRRFRA